MSSTRDEIDLLVADLLPIGPIIQAEEAAVKIQKCIGHIKEHRCRRCRRCRRVSREIRFISLQADAIDQVEVLIGIMPSESANLWHHLTFPYDFPLLLEGSF